jgi:hypothetical protein
VGDFWQAVALGMAVVLCGTCNILVHITSRRLTTLESQVLGALLTIKTNETSVAIIKTEVEIIKRRIKL